MRFERVNNLPGPESPSAILYEAWYTMIPNERLPTLKRDGNRDSSALIQSRDRFLRSAKSVYQIMPVQLD